MSRLVFASAGATHALGVGIGGSIDEMVMS